MPLEYNMDGLHAISFAKGCYVGQELIARAHYQGAVRKRLMPASIEAMDRAPCSQLRSRVLLLQVCDLKFAPSTTRVSCRPPSRPWTVRPACVGLVKPWATWIPQARHASACGIHQHLGAACGPTTFLADFGSGCYDRMQRCASASSRPPLRPWTVCPARMSCSGFCRFKLPSLSQCTCVF